jgi:hypothetical protein
MFGRFLIYGTVAGGLVVVGVIVWLAVRRG